MVDQSASLKSVIGEGRVTIAALQGRIESLAMASTEERDNMTKNHYDETAALNGRTSLVEATLAELQASSTATIRDREGEIEALKLKQVQSLSLSLLL